MMKALRLLGQSATLAVGLLAWSGCAAEPPAAVSVPETETMQPLEEIVERFQARLEELHAELDFVGATAAFVLANGELGAAATGMADAERQIPMTLDHRMPAASIGKTIAAATAISMAAEGLLGLDDLASEWLGDEPWFDRLPNHETITLRHLLSHSSGLTDHVFSDEYRRASRANREGQAANPDAYFAPRELVAFVLDKPPLFPAGQGYAYTDTGYIVAGLILETASAADYYAEAQRRVLDPLGLTRTQAQLGRTFEDLAAGYMGEENVFRMPHKVADQGTMIFNPLTEWTGGGYVSSSRDLARWAKALYEGKLLDSPYLDELLESGYRGEDAENIYGLGVFIVDNELGRIIGHGGWFPGWRSSMYYHPETGIAVALQVNQYEPDVHNILRLELFRVVLDAVPPAG